MQQDDMIPLVNAALLPLPDATARLLPRGFSFGLVQLILVHVPGYRHLPTFTLPLTTAPWIRGSPRG